MSARKLSRLAGLVLAFAVAFGGAGVAGFIGPTAATHTQATAVVDATALSTEWE
jgi:hypothetical protein